MRRLLIRSGKADAGPAAALAECARSLCPGLEIVDRVGEADVVVDVGPGIPAPRKGNPPAFAVLTRLIPRNPVPVAALFVATEEFRTLLVRRGWPAPSVRATGLPLPPAFVESPPRTAAARPRVRLFGAAARVLKRLAQACPHADVAAAGASPAPADFAAELGVAAPDLYLAGLAQARRLPLVLLPSTAPEVVFDLLERGCAVLARDADLVDVKVRALLESPLRLDMMARACGAAARPWAGRDILRTVLDEHPSRG
jgi:hypothetical protein